MHPRDIRTPIRSDAVTGWNVAALVADSQFRSPRSALRALGHMRAVNVLTRYKVRRMAWPCTRYGNDVKPQMGQRRRPGAGG
jgi:hypothetical protein